ncbi:MAG: nucleotidyltransferase family protein [Promethearchaeota archaeon]
MNVIDVLKKHKAEIMYRFRVKRMGVFGSFARGEEKESSDIDLVVEFDLSAFGENFKGLYDVYTNLSSYLEALFDRRLDILTPISIETIRVKEVAESIKRSVIYV